jgi:pimeloyl-ACP methyl ester carboxylesterase
MNRRIQAYLLLVQLLFGVFYVWAFKYYFPDFNLAACIVLAALACLSFLFILIAVQILFSQIHRGEPATIATPALPKLGLVDFIIPWLRESWDCIRVFSYMQIFNTTKPLARPGHENPNSGRVPVLLLHGYFCNRALWHPFAARLAKRGYVCHAITLEPAFGSIDEYADPIAQAIADLKHTTGASKVAIIGHSMGGLAARAYLRKHGNTDVAKVITLGTPHVGTWLGWTAHSSNGQQMNLRSLWLKRLAEHELSHPVGHLFSVILTNLDNIVYPQTAQTLPLAENIAITGVAHISMVFDDGVFELVSERLAAI